MGANDVAEVKNGSACEDRQDVSFFRLFRFAKWWELLLIFFAVIFAGISAACMPMIIITYGEFTTLLVDRSLTRGVVSSTKLLHLFGGAQVV